MECRFSFRMPFCFRKSRLRLTSLRFGRGRASGFGNLVFFRNAIKFWNCCIHFSCSLADGKSVKSFAILPDQKNKTSPGSPALATARIALEICHGQVPTPAMFSECSRFHPDRFTFG